MVITTAVMIKPYAKIACVLIIESGFEIRWHATQTCPPMGLNQQRDPD